MKINIGIYTITINKRHSYSHWQDNRPQEGNELVKYDEINNKLQDIDKAQKTFIKSEEESKYNRIKHTFGIVANEIFPISLATYLLLFLIDIIKPEFVSYFFNLNILLVVVIVSGFIMAVCVDEEPVEKRAEPVNWKYIAGVSFLTAIMVYYKTEQLQGFSFVMTILTGGIIFLLSYIISVEQDVR
jgi:hypothetical protein